jgi:2-iminobutanoate/2-iminopropanoate deaminase
VIERVFVGNEDAAFATAAFATGRTVYLSGQAGAQPQAADNTVKGQTSRALKGLVDALEAQGGNAGSVIRCNCFLAHIEDFADFDQAYAEFFDDHNAAYPVRTTVGVGLPEGILVEIDAIASLDP